MKEKKVTITSKNITLNNGQLYLLELNLLTQQWKSYADLELKAQGLSKVLGWGTKKYDEK